VVATASNSSENNGQMAEPREPPLLDRLKKRPRVELDNLTVASENPLELVDGDVAARQLDLDRDGSSSDETDSEEEGNNLLDRALLAIAPRTRQQRRKRMVIGAERQNQTTRSMQLQQNK
jgi:hypothetical protein